MRIGNIGPPPNFVTQRGAIASALAARVAAQALTAPVPEVIPVRENLTAHAWATLAARQYGEMHG